MTGKSKTGKDKAPLVSSAPKVESPVSYLVQEHDRWQALFQLQPALTQRFFETQAQALADALFQPLAQARFALPERVLIRAEGQGKAEASAPVPADQREQLVGGLLERLSRLSLAVILRQRLDELEASPNSGVSTAAGLLRFATAEHMVYARLPPGGRLPMFQQRVRKSQASPSSSRLRWLRHSQKPRMPLPKKGKEARKPSGVSCLSLTCRQPGASSCPNGWLSTNRINCWWVLPTKPKPHRLHAALFEHPAHGGGAGPVHGGRRDLPAETLRHAGTAD